MRTKTIGQLIDELTIVNLKIWRCEDIKHDNADNDAVVAAACRKTNILNPQRNQLIQAIDEACNELAEGLSQHLFAQGDTKSYGKKM